MSAAVAIEESCDANEFASELEQSLVAKLLLDQTAVAPVFGIVDQSNFQDLVALKILGAIQSLHRDGHTIDLITVGDELARTDGLSVIGGAGALAYIFDREATAVDALDVARRVRQYSLERRERSLCADIVNGRSPAEIRKQLAEVHSELAALEVGRCVDLTQLGFSGPRLDAMRIRPEKQSPLPGLLPPEPGLIILSAKPKTGKTTFAVYMAQSWACGVSPWEGAPALPGSRSLVISREQPVIRVDATMRRLDTTSECITREAWTERLTIVARDPELDRTADRLMTLDSSGVELLRQCLDHARSEGDPYGLIVFDSMSRLAPAGLDENSNVDVTHFLAPLQELAEKSETYLILIHHVGHAGRNEARSAGRGASAIGAVPQCVWLLKDGANDPKQRQLKVEGNAVLNSTISFRVATEQSEPGEILFWRPCDPFEGHSIDDLIQPGEEISTTELAWRIQEEEPVKGKRPRSQNERAASTLRESWQNKGLVAVDDGPRRAKMIRRFNDDCAGGID
jgi:replicative DNA helicase